MNTQRDGQEVGENTGTKSPCCSPTGRGFDKRDSPILAPTGLVDSQESRPDAERPIVRLGPGQFLMGTDYKDAFSADGEGPVRPVSLDAFEMDAFSVTNKDFFAFVRETNYRTDAERYGWSFVFYAHIAAERFESVVEDTVAIAPWWCKVPKAFWQEPEGPGSNVRERADHPVVHVSWNDAVVYAAWAGKSLPTEAEWEYAARGGLEQKLYPWGDELMPGGQHRCNIWQGSFPYEDTGDDGYAGSSPVNAYPPNGYGLSSMTGNVWEWCADWFGTTFEAHAAHNPAGPADGQSRVMKGGSFLCHASYCNRYRVAARTSNTPDSSASNVGFRCARRLAVFSQ